MPPLNKVPVDRVRQLLAQGLPGKVIAARLGINKSSVSQINVQMRREQVRT